MAATAVNRFNRNELYTNVVPDIVLTEWDSEIIGAPEKKERVNVVEKVAPQAKAARRTAILAISLISVVFALLAGIVWRYAVITEVGKDNIELAAQIEDQNSRIDSLSIDILEKSDLRSVQEKAALLDMGFADSSQITYIELSNSNAHSVEAQDNGVEAGFFEKLLKWEF